ncbi:aminoglycoside phosphotransferase family protein [Streptomyces sp. NBC_01476]|uniref:aminoglycoside phosphotransferase family protein n=1 Tax=Streptomyces sp. NBC_01476 TaxID=2903881 RepID=UPI002E35372D|nr:aminoglycoside phosphotransferase family protein [Streptomyces sp. NBC_01476]
MTATAPTGPVTAGPDLVRRLLAAQFPHWAGLPVVAVGTPGVDNITYRLGDAMSVRLPRFARWEGQVPREQEWLPRLGPLLPLAVPVPLAQGEPGEGYPFVWSVYRWLDGDRADLGELTDPRQTGVELARFLRALQSVDPAGGPAPGWSNGFRGCDLADERDSPVVAGRMRERIAALEGLTDTDALAAVWADALAAPVWDRAPVWVHGDPAPGNLLASGGRLSAVIDFGTLAVGDPAVDLIAAWTFLDGEARGAFRAELAVDGATWARGRAWGLSGILPRPAELGPDADPEHAARVRRRLADLVADTAADRAHAPRTMGQTRAFGS